MKSIKKILFTFFSAFLLYRAFDLLRLLNFSGPDQYTLPQLILIAFLFNLFITGIFAFFGFVYPSSKILPDNYYKIKRPEQLKTIYKILGIKYYRIMLLFTFWGRKKNRKKYFNGTKQGLHNFIYQTAQSEFGHLAAFILISILTIHLITTDYIYLSLIILLINIFGNAYPIILQRFHRVRIEQILRKGSITGLNRQNINRINTNYE